MNYGRFDTEALVNRIEAFTAGVISVGLLISVARFVESNISSTTEIGPYKLAFGALFIGISTGYYLGLAAEEGKADVAISFVLGILLTITGLSIYYYRISLVSAIILFSAVIIFLLFDSTLVSRYSDIREILDSIQDYLWIGLIVVGFIQYGIPIIANLGSGLVEWGIEMIGAFLDWTSGEGMLPIAVVILSIIGFIVVILGFLMIVGILLEDILPWFHDKLQNIVN